MALHVVAFALGWFFVFRAIFSAVRTFVVPRGAPPDWVTRSAFVTMRYVFMVPVRRASHLVRERALAYYAPVTLLTLAAVWLALVLVGYAAIYWSLGAHSWSEAINISRLSLLYLGSDVNSIPDGTILGFSETVISLLLAAILVSYLPALYSAFSQREQAVTGLETRAGSPPSPLKMLVRYQTIQGLDRLDEVWTTWQDWFATVEETHTALLPLVFYRSPQPDRSWVTAAGAVLDTASLVASTLDRPRDADVELCIRAGYLCLRRIAVLFDIPFNENPSPTDPISISRAEYDDVCAHLEAVGVQLKADREQAWRDFMGWRVNYDAALIGMAVLTFAPPGFWSSDRVPKHRSLFSTTRRAAKQAAAAARDGVLPG